MRMKDSIRHLLGCRLTYPRGSGQAEEVFMNEYGHFTSFVSGYKHDMFLLESMLVDTFWTTQCSENPGLHPRAKDERIKKL